MKKLLKLVLVPVLVFLVSCADDSTTTTTTTASTGSSSTTTTSTTSLGITLKSGSATTATDITSISADSAGFLTARVTNSSGTGLANEVVTFTTDIGQLNPATGTALTNSTGYAQVSLEFKEKVGAGTVTAKATVNSTIVTATKNFAVSSPTIQFGDNSVSPFVSAQLQVATSNLSANGSTSISAHVLDSSGSAFTTPIDVTFKTVCSSLATPSATIDSTVTTSSGIAKATYLASGCEGVDTVTATAAFGGKSFSATGTVTVASDSVGSIRFISVDPSTITLKGTGGAGLQETSTVKFQVVGQGGAALKDQSVTFSTNTSAGGLSFSPTTAISNTNGEVTTVVQAGSAPLVVNIIATVNSTTITTQSTGLVISAGLPHQNSFTLALSNLNPEAWTIDGQIVTVTAFLADVYNNPPPAGTAVNFRTEGGSIGSSCLTNSTGSCSVNWISQEFRPADFRSSILAYTQGIESFTDLNGDGKYSDSETFTDLPEVFNDYNENKSYDAGEFFADFDGDGSYDASGDTSYNGSLCNHTTKCSSTQTSLNISNLELDATKATTVIVLSASNATIKAESSGVTLADQTTSFQSSITVTSTIALDKATNSKDVVVTFSDINGQPLPSGTTILVTTSAGILARTTSYTQAITSTAGTDSFTFNIADSTSGVSGQGIVTIAIKTPFGIEDSISFSSVE